MFIGTSTNCIFDTYGISYVNIEGPFELKNAYCDAKLMNSNRDVQYHVLLFQNTIIQSVIMKYTIVY